MAIVHRGFTHGGMAQRSAASRRGGAGGGHYCPHCLRYVATTEARRCPHREACTTGSLDVALVHCPTCGLVLSAEVLGAEVLGAEPAGGDWSLAGYTRPTPSLTS